MEDTGQNGNGKENEKQPINSPPENNNHPRQPPPSQPPQQCPRCDSFNTKFCYYNNYSLSQPRYFCKSCRRYWTQGGTLRNVPVGGGCRKGAKRLVKSGLPSGGASCSSSFIGDCSRSVQEQVQQQQPPPLPLPLPPPPLPPLHLPQMRGYSNMGLPYANSFYSPSGILSSVTAMQNLNRPIGFNQVPLNGGGVGGIPGGNSANYSVLQGFSGNQNMITASQVVQQQIYRPQDPQMMVNPNQNRILGGSWTQGFINHNNPSGSNTTNVSWAQSMLLQPNNNMTGPDSAMNNPNQWPDDDDEDDHLPGYGPPPSSS